jgi:aminoglycoside phosphotransferase family enzyme/adenylate kinase family enzyme
MGVDPAIFAKLVTGNLFPLTRDMEDMSSSQTGDSNRDDTRDQQHALISSLSHADAYPHRVSEIRLIETHISWVILTGDYAYKIKKCVDFGFLDFSTLAKRKKFCEEELRLNGRLAPTLYLDVVPICGPAEKASMGGTGEAIEYAVKMRQFDLHNTFDHLLAQDALTADHMEETAEMLARFHSSIAIADETSAVGARFGTPEAIRQPSMENFDQLAASLLSQKNQHGLDAPLSQLRQWTADHHEALIPTFQARKRGGFIRECHGDLHLRNIVIWEGRVTPFDGIEFNDNLRWIDVISELAFLLMDLDDHQQPALARQLLNRYLSLTGDYGGLQVLRYYQVYRAMVRAKVAGLRLGQTENQNEVSQQLQEISNYLQLAERYTQPQKPVLIITHGLSGSGKTYLSKQLCLATELIHLRSDVERKRCFGLSETAQSHSAPSAGIYTPEATQKVYQHLMQLSHEILLAGFSVLVDATFLQRQHRDLFKSLARELHLPFTILHCEANDDILLQRIRARQTEGKDASEANEAILKKQHDQAVLDADEIGDTHSIQTAEEIDIENLLTVLM